jgi:adenylate cyclase
MYKARRHFLLSAEIVGHENDLPAMPPMVLSESIRRRINRLERATESYWGKVVHRRPLGLLASFETVISAVLGACEMQRRCSMFPPVPETTFGLQIGIHTDSGDYLRSSNIEAAEQLSLQLGRMSGIDGVAISKAAFAAFTPTMRLKWDFETAGADGLTAHIMNWRTNRPTLQDRVAAARLQAAIPRPERYAILRHAGREYRLDRSRPFVMIGRDHTNHIVIDDPRTSRIHCRITRRPDCYVLQDQSTNGTTITFGHGNSLLIKHSQIALNGSGRIAFGEPAQEGAPPEIEFEIKMESA